MKFEIVLKINAAVVHKECLYTAGDDLIIKCWSSILLNEISSAPVSKFGYLKLRCSIEWMITMWNESFKKWLVTMHGCVLEYNLMY